MVAVEKLNRLTNGQQKSLHESVGKFLEENLQGMKELGLVDEALLPPSALSPHPSALILQPSSSLPL